MRVKWLISLLTFMLLAAEARAEVVLIMRREAQPSGNYVRICDIARVEGPDQQAREVALVVLGPSPSQGEVRDFSRWEIESRLYEMGIQARIAFSGNESVTVYGNGAPRKRVQPENMAYRDLQPIPSQAMDIRPRETPERATGAPQVKGPGDAIRPIAKPAGPPQRVLKPSRQVSALNAMSDEAKQRVNLAISNYLADRYRDSGKRSDIEVEAQLLKLSAAIPYSAHEVLVGEALDGRVPGKAALRLLVRDEAISEPRQVEVEADTQVFARALVAARQLSKGEVLEKRDVAVTRVRMEAGKGYMSPSPKFAEGRELQRNLRPGEPVLAEDATPGQAVKRGQMVVVESAGKGWQIQSKGKAVEGGSVGDMIMVEDASNKTKFSARVTGRNTVALVVKKDYTKQ